MEQIGFEIAFRFKTDAAPARAGITRTKERRMVFPLGPLISGLAIATGGLVGLLLGTRLPSACA